MMFLHTTCHHTGTTAVVAAVPCVSAEEVVLVLRTVTGLLFFHLSVAMHACRPIFSSGNQSSCPPAVSSERVLLRHYSGDDDDDLGLHTRCQAINP